MQSMHDAVRPADAGDIQSLMLIAETCGLGFWSAEAFISALNDLHQATLVFEGKENAIFGFITGRISPEIGLAAEIYNIGVVPDNQRTGIGSSLLAAFIRRCEEARSSEVWLEVRESNSKAYQFYINKGFTVTGRRKAFYANPAEDALLMSRRLASDRAQDAC